MAEYRRKDSPFWWLFLETTKHREKTTILVGTTVTERRDSQAQAKHLYFQRMSELSARQYKLPQAQAAIRFRAFADLYDRDVIAHRRGKQRELEITQLLRGFFGDDLLSMIDRDRVNAYHTHRTLAKVSARSINREVDVLKTMLRDAVPKYLNASPIAGMKRLHTAPVQRRLMTPDEERRLLAACEDAQDRAIFILGIDTLVRLGDLLDLQRSDRVDAHHNPAPKGVWLIVRDPKSGTDTTPKYLSTTRARQALDAIADDGSPYYFTKFRKAANPRDWPGSVRQRLEYLCRQAKPRIPYGRAKHGVTFHWGTRRTGATRQAHAGIPLDVLKAQGGWKTASVVIDIYNEVQQKDMVAAYAKKRPAKATTGAAAAGRKLRLVRNG